MSAGPLKRGRQSAFRHLTEPVNGLPQSMEPWRSGSGANAMLDGHEETLLSYMLNVPRGWTEFVEIDGASFASQPRRDILCAITNVAIAGGEPNLLTVSDALDRAGRLEAVGGRAEITRLSNQFITSPEIARYAWECVQEASMKRRAQHIGEQLSNWAIEPQQAAEQLTKLSAPLGAKPLSIRTAGEVLEMPRDERSCLLGDRLWALGQPLVITGIGGIGKTRLTLQLCAATIMGREWCGIQTHGRGLRFLFLQTENSTYRLQDDLHRLREWAGKDWSLVRDNLLLHTLEADADMLICLADPESARRLESTIRSVEPDAVVIDPLRDFAIGDLNSDADMAQTVRALGRIARAGNPNRALLILHHALTGRAGAAKGFGLERGGFARNSKMLQTWARGMINIVPGSEDGNEQLILTCGKNSNGREFLPAAVRLNTETMIYEVDNDFDLDSWREILTKPGASKRRPAFNIAVIRDVMEPGATLLKRQVVKLIKDETGCGLSRAYELVEEGIRAGMLAHNNRTKTYELAA